MKCVHTCERCRTRLMPPWNTLIQTPPVIRLLTWHIKATSTVDLSLSSHTLLPRLPLPARRTQTAKWIQRLAWTLGAPRISAIPLPLVSIHHPCLFLSLPPCGLGAITQEATLKIYSHLPLLSPPFLSLLLYILCTKKKECPPAAIVAKMWSEAPVSCPAASVPSSADPR